MAYQTVIFLNILIKSIIKCNIFNELFKNFIALQAVNLLFKPYDTQSF